MASTDVVPVSGSTYFGSTPAAKKSDLDMATFLNLLVTQLQNQNPLEPMDDASFYGQIAQLGQVQGLDKLNTSADLSQAQTLLGKNITAVRPTSSTSGTTGETFTGMVTKVVIKSGKQYLNVQEDGGGEVQIEMSAIQSVLPNVDVASLSGLIGKTASAMSGTTKVIGTVIGISAENGQAIAQVAMDGKFYSIPVTTLQNVAAQ